jgi:hypothetical protein
MHHSVQVKVVNGRHVCDPTRTRVTGGDLVTWGGDVPISFPNSPFEEGNGPFNPGTTSTVKMGIKGSFPGSAEGSIDVDHP